MVVHGMVHGRRWLVGLSAATAMVAVLSACGGHPDQQASNLLSATVPSTLTSSSASPTPSTPTTSSLPSTSTSTSTSTTTTTPTSTKSTTTSRKPPVPTDPLTGQVLSHNPVIAAKIDNTGAGFPQFGINQADITYVEQVEGGLTRLVAVFHTVLPPEVGAMRSMRSTDVELLPTYGAPILAASGGSHKPMQMLADSVIVDATQQSGAPYYWRSQYGDGTHNLHVDLAKLATAYPGKGKAQPIGFTFAAKDPRLASAPSVTKIDVVMIAGDTSFHYAGGRYQVFHHGDPYVDQNGKDVYAQNVLVQHVIDEPDGVKDVLGSPSYLSHTVGTGKFTLYRDGKALSGTWRRPTTSAPTAFLDAHGKPVAFKPGKTWVLLAPQTSSFSAS